MTALDVYCCWLCQKFLCSLPFTIFFGFSIQDLVRTASVSINEALRLVFQLDSCSQLYKTLSEVTLSHPSPVGCGALLLLHRIDRRLCHECSLYCVGEGLVSRPHLLGEVHRGSYYLTSGKLKGRRNCLRLMKNERRKMKVMEKSRKSERTLTSCMDGMRQTHGLEPCDACKD